MDSRSLGKPLFHRLLVLSASIALAFASPASALTQGYVLRDIGGPPGFPGLGFSVAGIGDLNADGHADILVGAASPLFPIPGAAAVFSGADGTPLLSFGTPSFIENLGFSVARAGDINGDGVTDILLGAPGPNIPFVFASGSARVFSGLNGALLLNLFGSVFGDLFGHSVAGAGDVNGDGTPDLLVGAPAGAGYAKVLSGMTGAALLTFSGSLNDLLGTAVASAGDVNGDGTPDLLVGAPQAGPFLSGLPGYAKVFSGMDGSQLHVFAGAASNDRFGWSVAGAGDVSGDGVPDLIVGAPQLFLLAPGYVKVFSGAGGATLFTFTGGVAPGTFDYGFSVASAGDLDGDAVPEFLIGAPTGAGRVEVRSGSSGALLTSFGGGAPEDGFGYSVAAAGDANADGAPDIAVGVPFADGGAGRARILSLVGIPPGASPFGSGCSGTGGFAPAISTFGGTPSPGNPLFGIAVLRGRGGSAVGLFVGDSANPLGLPVGGCSVYLAGAVAAVFPSVSLAGTPGVAGAGFRLLGLAVPPLPALSGVTVHFQWCLSDPDGPNGLFTGSNALTVTIN